MDASMIATFLMRYYGTWELAEIEVAFEIGLLPDTYAMPEHYGVMTKEYVAEVLRLYHKWKMEVDRMKAQTRVREMAIDTDVVKVPTDEEQLRMSREIVANAYRSYCNGDKVMCLVPDVLYRILVSRGKLGVDDYKRYLTEAVTIEKAKTITAKPNRYHRETNLKDELTSGWDAKKIAMDKAIKVYFEGYRNRQVKKAET